MMPFGKCPRWIIDSGLTNRLGKPAVRVLFQLLAVQDGRSLSGRISVERIAERIEMSRRTALFGLKDLVDAGVLDYDHRRGEFTFKDEHGAQATCADAQDSCADHASGLRDSRRKPAQTAQETSAVETRNKEVPRSSYQELSTQQARGGAARVVERLIAMGFGAPEAAAVVERVTAGGVADVLDSADAYGSELHSPLGWVRTMLDKASRGEFEPHPKVIERRTADLIAQAAEQDRQRAQAEREEAQRNADRSKAEEEATLKGISDEDYTELAERVIERDPSGSIAQTIRRELNAGRGRNSRMVRTVVIEELHRAESNSQSSHKHKHKATREAMPA